MKCNFEYSISDRFKIIKTLIENGADPSLKSWLGHTALDIVKEEKERWGNFKGKEFKLNAERTVNYLRAITNKS